MVGALSPDCARTDYVVWIYAGDSGKYSDGKEVGADVDCDTGLADACHAVKQFHFFV